MSSGGPAGTPWLLGMIEGLRADGVELGDADLIVGTSAGAICGARLAGGTLEQAVTMYRRSELPPFESPATFTDFMAAAMRARADASDHEHAVSRIANLGPVGSGLVPEEDTRRLFAALVPPTAWPEQRLLVTAVDAESGLRHVFDAGSGVELLDAVMASCAGSGVFPLVEIKGRHYADGGLHSPYNADLAAGHGVVTVLSPLGSIAQLQPVLDAEIASLGGATVHVIVADEVSLAAIGPDLFSAETATAALEAGAAQARLESGALRSIWHAAP